MLESIYLVRHSQMRNQHQCIRPPLCVTTAFCSSHHTSSLAALVLKSALTDIPACLG